MGPKRWIDKKKADTYSLVYRSQEDPLINDPDASQRVLVKLDNLNDAKQKQERRERWAPTPSYSSTGGASKVLTADVLAQDEETFRKEGRRDNEGEAALYGIEYDDSKYDYMQHLKPIGEDPSAVYISKKPTKEKQSFGKDGNLLLKSDYAAANKVNLPSDVLPSKDTLKRTYQDQQNIPDEIAGLQPDMDPRLREVLEALEDEEYVDDDEDVFGQLISSGQKEEIEEDEDEWADYDPDQDFSGQDYSDDEAYDSDNGREMPAKPAKYMVTAKEGEEDWETAFRQFKLDQSRSKAPIDGVSDDEFDEDRDEVGSLSQVPSGRRITKSGRKQKIGAKTDLTGFSMSSSALFRNDGLTLLDNRFDKIEEEYNNDDDEEEEANEPFDMSKERDDLEAIMDDFLDNYVVEGKKMYKK
ncbi:Ltv1p [Sugiyamaella lignohabitans]|uniref:Ltv1p n=1 Tax=Sugiyamaella lignohabitans TaxID=796027 RepID=A0A167E7Z4_9ASCO|nr:Ltv1p [Sugiyamaella lignohabitans]ANB13752.1 Ltv1p [Sugiyamaella lignohabitans]